MLQADRVAAFRGERLVLQDISFQVVPGDALLLIGPNGAGKSTLLRVLAGLVRAEAGRVLWNGADALLDLPEHARRLAYLGHQDAIKPALTAAENLSFPPGSRAGIGAGIGAALARLGLAELADVPARMLSAGQRRRLALARVSLSRAPLWLLDEPTLGLDAAALDAAGALFADQRAAGGMIVAATHVALPLPDARELRLG